MNTIKQADKETSGAIAEYLKAENNLRNAQIRYNEAKQTLIDIAKPLCSIPAYDKPEGINLKSQYGRIDITPKIRASVTNPENMPDKLKAHLKHTHTILTDQGITVLKESIAELLPEDECIDYTECDYRNPCCDTTAIKAKRYLHKWGVKLAISIDITTRYTSLVEPYSDDK
jgi:hypothetical protein